MSERTFITTFSEVTHSDGTKAKWYYAFDPVAKVRRGDGGFDVNGDGTTIGSHVYFYEGDNPWNARAVKIYVHYDRKDEPDYIETITDYGIVSALKSMALLGFTDGYRYFVYLAMGMGRGAPREDKISIRNGGRHIVRARVSDLMQNMVYLPAGMKPDAKGFVVLFEE